MIYQLRHNKLKIKLPVTVSTALHIMREHADAIHVYLTV